MAINTNWNSINVLYEHKFNYRKRSKSSIYNTVDLNSKFLAKVHLSNLYSERIQNEAK